MKIALISFEYPPDTALGGIATYVRQTARMLHGRGHQVEVFAASPNRAGSENEEGIRVHRVQETNVFRFASVIALVFAERHALVKFDVVEGPDYRADAREAVALAPDVALVVKLHTPAFLLSALHAPFYGFATRSRMMLGALRKGHKPSWYPTSPDHDAERLHALDADEVAAPCVSIGEIVGEGWNIPKNRIALVPYSYTPAPSLLEIAPETQTHTVTYMGRLEFRKGVLDLAKAIPLVLKKNSQVKFRFVGRPQASPRRGQDMQAYLAEQLRPYRDSVEFTGGVAMEQIPRMLAQTDICVFPSLWENFPLVCLEAMAAARGVVGSSAGGMAEMLDDGRAGLCIPPQNPTALAEAIGALLSDPARRIALGKRARERVLSEYNSERIGALQEESYQRAIRRRSDAGPKAKSERLPSIAK